MDPINLHVIDGLYNDALVLLCQLIETPSISKEEHATAQLLEEFFAAKHIPTQRLANNVWATNQHYDPLKPTLLLNSHHDTVRPHKGYTLNPLQPLQKDGKLYGLGSNDAGGCLVSLIAAFRYFNNRTDLKYNLIIAATAEEEISGANGIEWLLPHLGSVAVAIVGEPTHMDMAIAEKGLMVLDCTASGVPGHAAHNEGVNAIYNAIDDIQWFRNFAFPEVSDLLGPVKMNVTLIQAGTQHNVIPGECHFVVDVRINEKYTHEQVLTTIREHTNCKVAPRSTRLRSTGIDTNHPLVAAGIAMCLKTFGSSTLSDKSLMPFPAVKMGPGDTLRSHIADEYILTEEIKQGIQVYIHLLNSIL